MRAVWVTLVWWIGRMSMAQEYSDYVLMTVNVDTQSHLDELETYLLSEELQVDVWSPAFTLAHPVKFTVSSPDLPVLESWLDAHQLMARTSEQLLQDLVDRANQTEEAIRNNNQRTGEGLDLNQYHDHDEMNAFLYETAASCDICFPKVIGQSYEGRDMVVLRVGRWVRRKRAIFMDFGIHAREWIASAVALQLIDKLVSGYKTQDPDAVWMVENFMWFFLPNANPDGYMHSRDVYRFWRKTRRPNPGSTCMGTDPNRNWKYQWGGEGTSDDPCSDIFRGPVPFSEVETRNIKKFIYRRQNRIDVYLSYHSYGQYWLYPWGYDSSLPENWEELHSVGQRAVNKIFEVSGKRYQLGSATNLLYAAAGASDDWAKGVPRIRYSYTVELRDEGEYGFQLPSDQIQGTADEQYAAITEMARAVWENSNL